METILTLICGLGWTLTYIVIIYNGFKYKTVSMPFAALSLNIAWEFLYSVEDLNLRDLHLQQVINIIWFSLDLVILFLHFKYGRKFFPKEAPAKLFNIWSLWVLAIAVCIQLSFYYYFSYSGSNAGPDIYHGAGETYSSFLQNLVMSFLFISQLYTKRNPKELSLYVAVLKCIGTFSLAIVCYVYGDMKFIGAIGVLIAIVDIVYIYLLYMRRKNHQTIEMDVHIVD